MYFWSMCMFCVFTSNKTRIDQSETSLTDRSTQKLVLLGLYTMKRTTFIVIPKETNTGMQNA